MKNSIVISGSSGGIGSSLVKCFKKNDYYVIGIDKVKANNVDYFVEADISNLEYRKRYRF